MGCGVLSFGIRSVHRMFSRSNLQSICWATLFGFAPWSSGHPLMFSFGIGMVLLVPEVISSILKLGAMMVLLRLAHVLVPFIGRKNGPLIARQQCYNDLHGLCHTRIEQLFARLWHWGLVR